MSRRASMAIVSVIVLLSLTADIAGPLTIKPLLATRVCRGMSVLRLRRAPSFMQATPAGTVPMTRSRANELHPPDTSATPETTCGSDPRTGQPYPFNPQTGQPCDTLPQERVVVRQPSAMRTPSASPAPIHEETPEERRLAAAYPPEQEAIQAPTSIRNSVTSSLSTATAQPSSNDLSQVEALSRALGARQGGDSTTLSNGQPVENDYDAQNMQSRKDALLTGARNRQADDYLRSTREAPLSRYEIKAGWEIPAVLEQSLNSDLPGELKALVTSNVYDTATASTFSSPKVPV